MSGYGNFNLNKKKKGKKAGIAMGIVAVLVIVGICYIGITAGSDGAEKDHISTAVQENVQLKQQISELNDQIAQLNDEIANLNAELGTRPTVAPTPYEIQGEIMPTEEPESTISPRTGLR